MSRMSDRARFTVALGWLLAHAEWLGIKVVFTSVYRSTEEQGVVFREGKSMCDGIRFRSKHQDWRAVDLAILRNDEPVWAHDVEYDLLGQFWEKIGGKWGGHFTSLKDIYHFEF